MFRLNVVILLNSSFLLFCFDMGPDDIYNMYYKKVRRLPTCV